MKSPDPSLESQAMSLPTEQRERLAERLLRSVDGGPLTPIDRAWIDEAEKRFSQWKAGEVEGVPGDQMTEQVRRELGWED